MLYKTTDEKELFKTIVPEINSLKRIFRENNLNGSSVESDVIDAVNNEINCRINTDRKAANRLSNKMYLVPLNKLNNDLVKSKIVKIIDKIIDKVDQFEKEYLEKI